MQQHPPERPMKLGVICSTTEGSPSGQTPHFRDLSAMVQAAEQVGFDSAWLPDHFYFRPSAGGEQGCWEAFTFLSGLAALTSRLQLGPLVACTAFRNPALLAKMADSLDEISQGRFILGLGAGWNEPEFRTFGYPFDHLASRFEEAVQIIVPLLRGERVTFLGRFYQAQDAVLRPRGPSQAGLPIWIGAWRPRMLELTVRYADAWNVGVDHARDFGTSGALQQLQHACMAVGRDPATIDLTAFAAVRLLGSGEQKQANESTISGAPEEVVDELSTFAREGVKHLVVRLSPGGLPGIERFARVIQLLDQRTPAGALG